MKIDATHMYFKDLNELIRNCNEDIVINNCEGQRYICSGMSKKNVTIYGTPGNALGSYLDGSQISVHGNSQDAVGDTMNDGCIVIDGNAGDALGYAMRGGKIYVRGNSGYRTGIHMKAYGEKKPVIVVGGSAGNFLGEYQAGGLIVVLGLEGGASIISQFTGTGMYGGKIFLRCEELPMDLPKQVLSSVATPEDLQEIKLYLKEYSDIFSLDFNGIMNSRFYVLKPNTSNPYKQLYTVYC